MELHIFAVITNGKFIHNLVSKETIKQVPSYVEMSRNVTYFSLLLALKKTYRIPLF